jgi:hypothetical protein
MAKKKNYGTAAARPKRGKADPRTASPTRRGGTAAARGGAPRVGPFKAKKSGFTQTAGQWTDTKPVSLRQKYQKAPYYEGGTVAARPRRVAKKPNEHLHRKPKYGQPQYSSNFNPAAAKNMKQLQASISKAVRDGVRNSKRGRT